MQSFEFKEDLVSLLIWDQIEQSDIESETKQNLSLLFSECLT